MSALVIDANSVVVRAIMNTALDDLKAGGVFTGGVYGTLRSLMSLLGQPEIRADRIFAFFDGGIPKRRLNLVPEYKANRKEKRELLSPEDKERAYVQLDLCWEMMELLGIRVTRYAEREADDAVAAAARIVVAEKQVPIVVSGDHDLYQTVRMGAEVWDIGVKKLIDQSAFVDQFKFNPGCFLLYRTLIGDTSDGIKGAGGIGDKRATELIEEMGCHVDAMSHGGFDFYDIDPCGQLNELVNYLNNPSTRPKGKSKAEENLVAGIARLRNVLHGIDLSNSFGPTSGLATWMKVPPEPPNKMKFLGFCNRLKFKSVLGSPDMYFRPFQQAYERRLKAHSAG